MKEKIKEKTFTDKLLEKVLSKLAPLIFRVKDGTVTMEEALKWLKEEGYDDAVKLTIQETSKQFENKIKDRIEELKNPTIICPKCKFKGKDKDYNYDKDACEMTCPECGTEVYFYDYSDEIKELEALLHAKVHNFTVKDSEIREVSSSPCRAENSFPTSLTEKSNSKILNEEVVL